MSEDVVEIDEPTFGAFGVGPPVTAEVPVEETPEVAYAFKYIGPGHVLGIPAHDLTFDEVDALEAPHRADLEASTAYESTAPATPDVAEVPTSETTKRRGRAAKVNDDG